jgi:predicted RNA polymerase sigma factor
MDDLLLRELTPAVIGVLVRRGVDFATAEDAVQEALLQAALTWPDGRPADPKGWLVTDRPRPRTTPCSCSSCAPIRR